MNTEAQKALLLQTQTRQAGVLIREGIAQKAAATLADITIELKPKLTVGKCNVNQQRLVRYDLLFARPTSAIKDHLTSTVRDVEHIEPLHTPGGEFRFRDYFFHAAIGKIILRETGPEYQPETPFTIDELEVVEQLGEELLRLKETTLPALNLGFATIGNGLDQN